MDRIVHIERRQVAPRYREFNAALKMIPQPIDHDFIEN